MNKDITFEGVLAVLVSLLFLLMTVVEIPFYRQEIEVQQLMFVVLAGSVALLLIGLLSGNRKQLQRGV